MRRLRRIFIGMIYADIHEQQQRPSPPPKKKGARSQNWKTCPIYFTQWCLHLRRNPKEDIIEVGCCWQTSRRGYRISIRGRAKFLVFLPEACSSIDNNENPTFNENPLKHFFFLQKILISGWFACLFFVSLAPMINLKYLKKKKSKTRVQYNVLAMRSIIKAII